MKIGVVMCVALASAALGAVAAWPLQDAKAKDTRGAPGQPSAAETARMMAAATPGPQHKSLANMVGHWKTDIAYVLAPGAPAMASSGTDDFTMTIDGRYLMDNHSSTGPMGPFKGMGITGYNNVTGTYENVWFDSMGTGILYAKGTMEPGSDTVTYTGEYKDPMTGLMTGYRNIMHKVSADAYTFQMWTKSGDAPEFMALDIKYARQK